MEGRLLVLPTSLVYWQAGARSGRFEGVFTFHMPYHPPPSRCMLSRSLTAAAKQASVRHYCRILAE